MVFPGRKTSILSEDIQADVGYPITRRSLVTFFFIRAEKERCSTVGTQDQAI